MTSGSSLLLLDLSVGSGSDEPITMEKIRNIFDRRNIPCDELRRYKVDYIVGSEFFRWETNIAVFFEEIGKRLDNYDPGTGLIHIYYDAMRAAYAFVLQNDSWPSVPTGEYLPRYEQAQPIRQSLEQGPTQEDSGGCGEGGSTVQGAIPDATTRAIADGSIIDVELCDEAVSGESEDPQAS